jgi:cytidyltransferase-like protein
VGDILRVLFSGRFDPDHKGHWTTILKLLRVFDKVLVVILDYPERRFPALESKRSFETQAILSGFFDRVQVVINKTHFAKITIEEWESYHCQVYAGGNPEVNDHIGSLGIPVYEQERSGNISARNIKKENEL